MTSQIKTLLLLAALSGIIIFFGGAVGGQSGLVIAFVIAIGMNFFSYWFSDKMVLSMYRARELSPLDAPMLHSIVEELARNAGIPKPRIAVMPEEAPNAFATGRNPEHGVVAVTEGLMRLLTPEEIRGVLAHEIAHIAHRDIFVQNIAATLATVITFLASFARFAAIFGGNNREGGNPIAGLLMAILAPIAAALIQFAISRSREYLADEGGAKYSGNPRDLASALDKLQNYSRRIPMDDATPATAHMFIVSPLSGGSLAGLFSTHPPMEERIRRLLAMQNS